MEGLMVLISREDEIKRYIDEVNAINTIDSYGGALPVVMGEITDIDLMVEELPSIRNKIISGIECNLLYEKKGLEYRDLHIILNKLKKRESDIDEDEELSILEEDLVKKYYEVYQQVFEGLGNIPEKSNERDGWLKKTSYVLTFDNEINNILNLLVQTRNKLASKKGFVSFQEYCEVIQGRTSLNQCEFEKWKNNVSKSIIPVIQGLYRNNTIKMGYEQVSPWKLDELELIDCAEEIDIMDYMQNIIESIADLDQEFSEYVKELWEQGFIDLRRSEGKVDFGYCVELPFSRKSYVSIFPTGSIFDVFYLIHELGHVFHYYCKIDLPHSTIRDCNNEINELAAHIFEITLIFHMFEKKPNILRAYITQLVISIPYNIAIHEFQEELYHKDYKTKDSKYELFYNILKKYTHCEVEMNGCEKEVASIWLLNEQVFSSPFYYLEYSFAKLCAIHYIDVILREENEIKIKEKFRQILTNGNRYHPREIFQKGVGSPLLMGESDLLSLSSFVERILNIK